jgi:periplasmic protein TonB
MMKYLLSFLTLIMLIALTGPGAIPVLAAGQTAEFDKMAFDQAPEPIGGMAAIGQHVVYPQAAKEAGIQGKVFVAVTVGADGHAKSVTVQKGVNSDLDQAAVKALEQIHWKPAMKDGKPVETSIVVPIQFKLEDKKK